MEVAIIGAGNVGRALAGSSIRAGHAVTISASDPENARNLAAEIGGRAAESNREAIDVADVVVLAVPYQALDGLLDEVGDALGGKIVIDVTNRVNPADPGLFLDGTSAAEQIQSRVPSARVFKSLNYAFASNQADPVVEGTRLDGFVAGDDEESKSKVLDLVRSIGFRPIDAGPLAMARALEAMASLNIVLQIRNDWAWQSGWKLVGPDEPAA
jgi:8-hydroxy-5-deazaflavin:NADPH oxidoreductase